MSRASSTRAVTYTTPHPRRHAMPGVTLPTRVCSCCKRIRPLAGGSGARKPWRCAGCNTRAAA